MSTETQAPSTETTSKSCPVVQVPNVVYLYGYARTAEAFSTSGPCGVVEVFLRAAKIPYVFLPTSDFMISPTGRLPYIELNGTGTADSSFIIKRLQREFPTEVAANTKPIDRADVPLATFLQRTLHSSVKHAFMRHTIVDSVPTVTAMARGVFPPLPEEDLPKMVEGFREEIITTLNTDGYGDLTNEEYKQVVQEDLAAFDQLLEARSGPGQFALGGTVPTEVDAQLYAWLAMLHSYPLPLFAPVREGALARYVKHVRETLFPDDDVLRSPPQLGPLAKPTGFHGAAVTEVPK